jgi:hypothetical protein
VWRRPLRFCAVNGLCGAIYLDPTLFCSFGSLRREGSLLASESVRIVLFGMLILHGIAHAIALFAVVAQSLSGLSDSRVTLTSWLFL